MSGRVKILIAQSNQEKKEKLNKILSNKYNIIWAETKDEAISALLKEGPELRVVITDINMPEEQGLEIIRYININGLLDKNPVLIFAKEEDTDKVSAAFEMGALDVMREPYDSVIIKHRISNVLNPSIQPMKDSLTGGLNRAGFISKVNEILYNDSEKNKYAIFYFNIKNFKATNELFGVDGGDYVLKKFYSDLVVSPLNPLAVARLEADHFVCIANVENIDYNRISKRMEAVIELKDKRVRMFARYGVYIIKDPEIPVSGMLDRAKLAKQKIVDEMVKPYAIYDESMKIDYVDKAEALIEFEDGIKNNEFVVYYQPVIEAKTGELVSAEALIRWVHPEKGFISPASFIPALEKNGHITRLDRFVLEHVNKTMEERVDKGLKTVPVSVNLSWMDFYDDSMVYKLLEMLKEEKIAKGRIRLEVTETSYAALEQNRASLIENLRSLGAVILLDDFGSGYSSFGMLEKYDFDILKIDMSFVKKLMTNEKARIITDGIIKMCHKMGVKVVAEGAEEKEQVEILRNSGCDYIQGYYYSKPLPEKEFLEYIDKSDNE